MIKFTLFELPYSLNKWQNFHWAKKKREKDRLQRDIHFLTCSQKPKKPYEKAKVTVTMYFKTKRNRDILNFPLKAEIDCLVDCGIIKDDNINVIGKPEIVFAHDPKNPRTEYIITEV